MKVADRFKQIFGVCATEIWALPEDRFLEWLNSDAPELHFGIKEITNSEILERLYKHGNGSDDVIHDDPSHPFADDVMMGDVDE